MILTSFSPRTLFEYTFDDADRLARLSGLILGWHEG